MRTSEAICTEPLTIGQAIIDGVAHTDVGLTLATLILAVCTFMLIDDRRMQRLHDKFTHVTHPFRKVHAVKDDDTTFANGDRSVSHTELTMEEEN